MVQKGRHKTFKRKESPERSSLISEVPVKGAYNLIFERLHSVPENIERNDQEFK